VNEHACMHASIPIARSSDRSIVVVAASQAQMSRYLNTEVLREVHDASYRTMDQLRVAVCD
jgi:hypothetical protein